MTEVLKKPVVAVQRSIAILKLLGASKEPLGIHELARALEIVPSTCMHILKTLVHEGMVSYEESSRKYRLGSLVLSLAADLSDTNDFIQNVQPLLDEIAAKHHVTTVAAWLEGKERIVVVAKSQISSNFSINVNIGSRFPSFVSTAGQCLAAFTDVPGELLRRHFDQVNWQNPPDFKEWVNDIDKVRQTGFAKDQDHFIDGVTILSAPVFDIEGKPTRFLSVIGFSQSLNGDTGEKLGLVLKQAGDEISNIYT